MKNTQGRASLSTGSGKSFQRFDCPDDAPEELFLSNRISLLRVLERFLLVRRVDVLEAVVLSERGEKVKW